MPPKRKPPAVTPLPRSEDTPEYDTEPLFDMDRVAVKGPESKRAYLQPAGWVSCPKCVSLARVAVMRSGIHLTYREHRFKTWSGGSITCVASLQRLCDLPPKPGSLIPICTCGGGGR